MPTERDVLTLTQWLSPAFPVGAFAYSHGLEWAVESGAVTDAVSTGEWIEDVLRHGAGWNDVLFLSAAYRAKTDARLHKVDARNRAFAASRERLTEADLQGAAFCDVTSAIWSVDLRGLTYPVALGQAARRQELPVLLTAQMYLHSFAGNLVGAAMRLVPLGQTAGQGLIHRLTGVAADVACDAVTGTLRDLSSTTFLADIASMKHETQYSRMFRT